LIDTLLQAASLLAHKHACACQPEGCATEPRRPAAALLPYTQAKPYGRLDYSHSKNRLMKIAHDNQLLVDHLTVISKAVRAAASDKSATHTTSCTTASAQPGTHCGAVLLGSRQQILCLCAQHNLWMYLSTACLQV
jgi:hypothetical protein